MEIKIKFVDFWRDFDNCHNYFVDILSKKYDVILSDEPDYLMYATCGYEHLKYDNCVKIQFIGEHLVPDFNVCDYAIGFDIMEFGDRYLRLPLYVFYGIEKLNLPKIVIPEVVLNRKFCSFVVSNTDAAPERTRFFHLLSEYKQVDSGGKVENNIGGPVDNKLEFIKGYKFNIAFENAIHNGYTTEKLLEPMLVNSLPIYWGNKQAKLDFNPNSFIHAANFTSLEALVEYIVQLDKNEEQYLSILSEPWLNNDNYLNWKERLLEFFDGIFEKPKNEQKYLIPYGNGKWYLNNLRYMLDAASYRECRWEKKKRRKERKEKCNPLYWLKLGFKGRLSKK